MASGASTALVPYSGGAGIVHDYQTTVLLNLLRGKDSRKWLKEWLSEEGRVAKVREIVEQAPPQLQGILAGVLGRRLDELSEDLSDEQEREVRITLMGGKAMLEPSQAAKGGNEEKPLPRPLPQARPLLLCYNPALDATDVPSNVGGGGRMGAKKTAVHMHMLIPTPPVTGRGASAQADGDVIELASSRAAKLMPKLVSVPEEHSVAGNSPPRIEELEEWEAAPDGAFAQSHRAAMA